MEKKDIRKQIFAARKSADEQELLRQSAVIMKKIIGLPAYREAECIYVYMDYNREVCTKSLIEQAWADGKRVAAPKVLENLQMRYYYIHSYAVVHPGYFQIPEPKPIHAAAEEKALLIVPGVAFDANRHRCGYGKGFYDRYLAIHQEHPTIAVAFDFQIVDEVPAGPYDLFPQLLITETREWGCLK